MHLAKRKGGGGGGVLELSFGEEGGGGISVKVSLPGENTGDPSSGGLRVSL